MSSFIWYIERHSKEALKTLEEREKVVRLQKNYNYYFFSVQKSYEMLKMRIHKTTSYFVSWMPASALSVFPTNNTVQQIKNKHILSSFILISLWKNTVQCNFYWYCRFNLSLVLNLLHKLKQPLYNKPVWPHGGLKEKGNSRGGQHKTAAMYLLLKLPFKPSECIATAMIGVKTTTAGGKIVTKVLILCRKIYWNMLSIKER